MINVKKEELKFQEKRLQYIIHNSKGSILDDAKKKLEDISDELKKLKKIDEETKILTNEEQAISGN